MDNVIEEKIAISVGGLSDEQLANLKLEVALPHATSFLKLWNDSAELMTLLGHPFVYWMNSNSHLGSAYQILINNGLLSEKKDKHTKKYLILEFICANVIHFVARFNGDLSGKIAPSKKSADSIYNAMRTLKKRLSQHHGIYCQFESKQYLLQHLLEDILNDQEEYTRNVYSSGTDRDLMRAIMTKRFLLALHMDFKSNEPHSRLIAMVASELTAIFYKPMDIGYAANLSEEVRKNHIVDEDFRKSTIQDYLAERLAKGVG